MSGFSLAQADGLQAVGDLQQQPDKAHDERRHQRTEVERKAQHQQSRPQNGAGSAHHVVGLVGRLAELVPLRLIAAFKSLFPELRVVDAALLLRVHLPGQVH